MKSLEEHLKEKEAETKKKNDELKIFKRMQKLGIPLSLKVYCDHSFDIFSEQYSLAEGVEIKKRDGRTCMGGWNCYDGGYDYSMIEWYPQFYFNINLGKKKEKVYLRHDGFEEDKKVIIKSIEHCHGWGDYTDHTKQTDQRVDPEIAYKFFRKRGVKEELIEEVKRKLKAGGDL